MKDKKEKKAAKFLAFVIGGIAIGAAAYYLLGTKEGKKALGQAVDGVNGMKKNLQSQAEAGLQKAVKLANKAKEEYHKVLAMAEQVGQDAKKKADHYQEEAKALTDKGLKHVEKLSKDVQQS